MTQLSRWRTLYEAAVLEVDDTKCRERLAIAQEAIDDRRRELLSASKTDSQERQHLADALQTLHVLLRNLPADSVVSPQGRTT